MRRLIERILARFGYAPIEQSLTPSTTQKGMNHGSEEKSKRREEEVTVLYPELGSPAPEQPTLAEACFQFGVREAQLRARYHAELQNAYVTGHAQGEFIGRTELHREIAAQYGIDGGERNMTSDDVALIGMRQVH